jgi:hypothetical protein
MSGDLVALVTFPWLLGLLCFGLALLAGMGGNDPWLWAVTFIPAGIGWAVSLTVARR